MLLAPPSYFKNVSDDGLFVWFSSVFPEIGASARDVILYNIPSVTAVEISVDLVTRLREAFPNIVAGVKDSSGNWTYTEKLLAKHKDLAILIGDERDLAAGVRLGGQGAISGMANLYADRLLPMINEGREDPAMIEAVNELLKFPVTPAVKALVAHHAGDDGLAPGACTTAGLAGFGLQASDRHLRPLVCSGRSVIKGEAKRFVGRAGMDDGNEPVRLREKAYASFTEHLLARDINPGQFVSQRQLVAMTGMPLGAIRELVPRLEAEGLVKTIPQRGIQIAHIDLNLIREAFQFRLFMEKEAIALFCISASDELLAKLRKEHEDTLEEALQGKETPELELRAQTIDWNLHETIIDSLGNGIIARAYRINAIKMRLINQERFRITGRVVPVMREHLAVLTAIETRDPQAAMDAIAVHINNARNLALKL